MVARVVVSPSFLENGLSLAVFHRSIEAAATPRYAVAVTYAMIPDPTCVSARLAMALLSTVDRCCENAQKDCIQEMQKTSYAAPDGGLQVLQAATIVL